MNMVCDPRATFMEIYTQGQYSNGLTGAFGRDAVITCYEPTLKTVRLAEGDYFIGKLGAQASFVDIDERDAIMFTVRRDSLNYVGDIIFRAVSPPGRITYVNITVKDNRDEVRNRLAKTYPELAARFDYVVSIASK